MTEAESGLIARNIVLIRFQRGRSDPPRPPGACTGSVLGDGLILTAAHCFDYLAESDRVLITYQDKTVTVPQRARVRPEWSSLYRNLGTGEDQALIEVNQKDLDAVGLLPVSLILQSEAGQLVGESAYFVGAGTKSFADAEVHGFSLTGYEAKIGGIRGDGHGTLDRTHEATASPSDSGSPVYVRLDSLKQAGIVVWIDFPIGNQNLSQNRNGFKIITLEDLSKITRTIKLNQPPDVVRHDKILNIR